MYSEAVEHKDLCHPRLQKAVTSVSYRGPLALSTPLS